MIYVGIDISKISTALCIENNNKTSLFSYTTKKENNIWVKDTNDFIHYNHIEYLYGDVEYYGEREILKLGEFDHVTSLIINDMIENIPFGEKLLVNIEGFSFNSKRGPIIDIVEFSTILKHKILKTFNNVVIDIISPLTLKTFSCEQTYGYQIITKGVRVIKKIKVVKDNENKLGKDFDKKDMFKAYINGKIKDDFKEHLNENKDIILKNKDLPKPIDDIIDSIFLKELVKKNNI